MKIFGIILSVIAAIEIDIDVDRLTQVQIPQYHYLQTRLESAVNIQLLQLVNNRIVSQTPDKILQPIRNDLQLDLMNSKEAQYLACKPTLGYDQLILRKILKLQFNVEEYSLYNNEESLYFVHNDGSYLILNSSDGSNRTLHQIDQLYSLVQCGDRIFTPQGLIKKIMIQNKHNSYSYCVDDFIYIITDKHAFVQDLQNTSNIRQIDRAFTKLIQLKSDNKYAFILQKHNVFSIHAFEQKLEEKSNSNINLTDVQDWTLQENHLIVCTNDGLVVIEIKNFRFERVQVQPIKCHKIRKIGYLIFVQDRSGFFQSFNLAYPLTTVLSSYIGVPAGGNIVTYQNFIYHVQNRSLEVFEVKKVLPKIYCHFDSSGAREYIAIIDSVQRATEISLIVNVNRIFIESTYQQMLSIILGGLGLFLLCGAILSILTCVQERKDLINMNHQLMIFQETEKQRRFQVWDKYKSFNLQEDDVEERKISR